MPNAIRLCTLLIFTALFPTAHADEAPPPADIRCLMVGMRLSSFSDAAQRTGGNMLAIYYFGRLEKFSAQQLEDAILKESLTIRSEDFQAESSRCGKILMEKGQVITKIGDDLVRRGKELAEKPAAPPAAH
jgi:hypothetical protein